MVKAIVALFVGAEAGTLAVTWDDCGAQHSKITDLQPTSFDTGSTTTLTGKGTVDETVTSAKFTATVKAKGIKIASCEGDGTKDIDCKLPAGAGVITVKAVTYPLGPGEVPIPVDVKTSKLIPSSLAAVDTEIRATDQNGESVICMNVHTKKQESFQESCTSGSTNDPCYKAGPPGSHIPTTHQCGALGNIGCGGASCCEGPGNDYCETCILQESCTSGSTNDPCYKAGPPGSHIPTTGQCGALGNIGCGGASCCEGPGNNYCETCILADEEAGVGLTV